MRTSVSGRFAWPRLVAASQAEANALCEVPEAGIFVAYMENMKVEKKNILGMDLDEWTHKSCVAHFGVGDDWATLYDIESAEPGRGHATELLTEAKRHYEEQGKKFGGTVALNEKMRNIYQRLNITEYAE